MLLMFISLSALIDVGFFSILLYNRLIRGRNEVKNAWCAIEVQLKWEREFKVVKSSGRLASSGRQASQRIAESLET